MKAATCRLSRQRSPLLPQLAAARRASICPRLRSEASRITASARLPVPVSLIPARFNSARALGQSPDGIDRPDLAQAPQEATNLSNPPFVPDITQWEPADVPFDPHFVAPIGLPEILDADIRREATLSFRSGGTAQSRHRRHGAAVWQLAVLYAVRHVKGHLIANTIRASLCSHRTTSCLGLTLGLGSFANTDIQQGTPADIQSYCANTFLAWLGAAYVDACSRQEGQTVLDWAAALLPERLLRSTLVTHFKKNPSATTYTGSPLSDTSPGDTRSTAGSVLLPAGSTLPWAPGPDSTRLTVRTDANGASQRTASPIPPTTAAPSHLDHARQVNTDLGPGSSISFTVSLNISDLRISSERTTIVRSPPLSASGPRAAVADDRGVSVVLDQLDDIVDRLSGSQMLPGVERSDIPLGSGTSRPASNSGGGRPALARRRQPLPSMSDAALRAMDGRMEVPLDDDSEEALAVVASRLEFCRAKADAELEGTGHERATRTSRMTGQPWSEGKIARAREKDTRLSEAAHGMHYADKAYKAMIAEKSGAFRETPADEAKESFVAPFESRWAGWGRNEAEERREKRSARAKSIELAAEEADDGGQASGLDDLENDDDGSDRYSTADGGATAKEIGMEDVEADEDEAEGWIQEEADAWANEADVEEDGDLLRGGDEAEEAEAGLALEGDLKDEDDGGEMAIREGEQWSRENGLTGGVRVDELGIEKDDGSEERDMAPVRDVLEDIPCAPAASNEGPKLKADSPEAAGRERAE